MRKNRNFRPKTTKSFLSSQKNSRILPKFLLVFVNPHRNNLTQLALRSTLEPAHNTLYLQYHRGDETRKIFDPPALYKSIEASAHRYFPLLSSPPLSQHKAFLVAVL